MNDTSKNTYSKSNDFSPLTAVETNLRQPSFKPVLPTITTATQNGGSERRFVRPAWMIGSPECDWTEDADHENGQYFNKCVCCACDFIGHKQRHVCKRCHAVGEAYVAGMTAEERAEWEVNRDAAISEYLRANSAEQAQAAINAAETA